MTELIPFTPNANTAFQFSATLDGAQYNVVVGWNLFGQRWYTNIYDLSGNLVVALPFVPSEDPRPLAPPLQVEVIASLTWTSDAGGTVAVVMAAPSSFALGDTIQIDGATNTGTGGDAAVNGAFVVNTWTDDQHFTFLLNAGAGVIGTIGGTPVLVLDTHALTWSNLKGRGLVKAHTTEPHGYALGSVVDLTIMGASPPGFNGQYRCAITGPSEFTYEVNADPGTNVAPGFYAYDLSMTRGYFASTMVWRESQGRFEINP